MTLVVGEETATGTLGVSGAGRSVARCERRMQELRLPAGSAPQTPDAVALPEPERQTMDHADENGSREPLKKAGSCDAGHASETKNDSRESENAGFCEHAHTAEAWLSSGVSVACETARRFCSWVRLRGGYCRRIPAGDPARPQAVSVAQACASRSPDRPRVRWRRSVTIHRSSGNPPAIPSGC